MIRENAVRLGAEKIEIIEGNADQCIHSLEQPDAIFIGGDITNSEMVDACWSALRDGGRLVANAVTLEGEAVLSRLHEQLGGAINRITVQGSEKVGRFRGWKPIMPVTQWVGVK